SAHSDQSCCCCRQASRAALSEREPALPSFAQSHTPASLTGHWISAVTHSTMVHLGGVSSNCDPTPQGGIDANKTFTAGYERRFGRDARAGGALFRASAKPTAGRPHRTSHFRSGRRDGGGGGQRQEGGLDGHRQRGQRCARPLQLSGQSLER